MRTVKTYTMLAARSVVDQTVLVVAHVSSLVVDETLERRRATT